MTQLRSLLEKEFAARHASFEIPADKVPLASPTYGVDEIEAALEVLLSSRVTQGERVFAFERQFAEYIGSKHAVMVNSGSSANLLAC
ncbi:MAG: DegT/DnrJ/EryC1/StrS aminotransferase family protein [Proteobacteria bacterium]|nr:MAG: DegT/DnrJ/EryC1/StrS aminotransferase family protein [Pseudomonadota bacterium]